jgi:hypothetical protein
MLVVLERTHDRYMAFCANKLLETGGGGREDVGMGNGDVTLYMCDKGTYYLFAGQHESQNLKKGTFKNVLLLESLWTSFFEFW